MSNVIDFTKARQAATTIANLPGITPGDIIGFINICNYIKHFSTSETAKIFISDEDLMVKVNNYVSYDETSDGRSGTNIEHIAEVEFFDVKTDADQIKLMNNIKWLLEKLINESAGTDTVNEGT
jgi:hypothetical protein